MKSFQWPLRALFFVGLLQLISCTKNVDSVQPDAIGIETSSDATAAFEFSDCKLRRIVHENPFVSESTVNCLFTYNSAGNPVSVIKTDPLVVPTSGYHTLNYYFRYDKKNRLRELLIAFGEDRRDEYTELHRYGYDNNDVIVIDTVLHPDWETGGLEDWIAYKTIGLTYDSQGRIIKETIKDLVNGTTRNPTYTYDNRGNLGVIGWKSSGYDHKVSIFRAHPIFQFVHRNYSRNNALPEASYNSKGLPRSVRHLNDDFFGAYRVNPNSPANPLGGIIKAMYDCQ
jgi:hypothetical protein